MSFTRSFEMSLSFRSTITRFFSGSDVAVDLGTANTRVFTAGAGLFVDVPTKVKISPRKKRIYYNPAENGSTRKSEIVMPLQEGVIRDVPAAAILLKNLLKKACCFGLYRPRVLICAPSDVSEREKAALVEATQKAGAAAVAIIPEPLAAAVGAGLDISSPYAQMLVDIGDGVTDIAIIRDGNLIQTAATRTAGSNLHRAVQRMMAARYPVIISRNDAEVLTRKLGAVYRNPRPDFLKIYGVGDSGQKIPVDVLGRDVCEAINPVVQTIVETVRQAVREMSPEVCAEVAETGICLTGGVAELPGIDKLISDTTNLPVELAPAPMNSVINGARLMLETSVKTSFWEV